MKIINNTKITVCSNCKRACCWQGIIMCDGAQMASTIDLTVRTLKRLNLEHSDYWKNSISSEDQTSKLEERNNG